MNNNAPLQRPAAGPPRPKKPCGRTVLAALIAGAFTSSAAKAQVMQVQPAIWGEVTFSNNGNQAPSGQEESDVAIEVRPELWVTYETARLRARGVVGMTATTYIGGNREGSLFPAIDLGATLNAIQNFFYIDADVVASRQFISPFAPRSTSGEQNAYASYAYRVAPYFQGEVPRYGLRYLLRNDFYYTYATGGLGDAFDRGFEWRIRGELSTDGRGRRYDVLYQYERDYLKFPDSPEFIVEVGRVVGTYRVNPYLSVNARGGYEWEIFPASEGSGPIYGAGISWQPTPRSNATAWWEHRFFGPSWLADVSHRTPFFAASASSSRLLKTGTQSLFNVPRTNDVFRSLDSILSSRIPDPIERSRAVRDLLALTGLPASLGTPVPVFSQRVDLQTAHGVSIGFLGARNSLVADAYYLDREGITAEGDPLPVPLRIFTDETQTGASLTYSRRLRRADSVNATVLWQRTEGSTLFNSNAESTQWTTRVQYNKQLRPRTTAYAGARFIKYESNVFTDFNEASVFAGAYHRF
jgi:uncharacterized protein (PEP-CTERM system associated)